MRKRLKQLELPPPFGDDEFSRHRSKRAGLDLILDRMTEHLDRMTPEQQEDAVIALIAYLNKIRREAKR
jgi:hypothetical protein